MVKDTKDLTTQIIRILIQKPGLNGGGVVKNATIQLLLDRSGPGYDLSSVLERTSAGNICTWEQSCDDNNIDDRNALLTLILIVTISIFVCIGIFRLIYVYYNRIKKNNISKDDKTEIEMTTGGSAKSMLTVPEISEFKKDEDGMTLNPLRKMY